MNSWQAQVNTMADNMKLMFARSADKINRPILTIASSAMDDKDDLPPTITDTRNRQVEEDGTRKKPVQPRNPTSLTRSV